MTTTLLCLVFAGLLGIFGLRWIQRALFYPSPTNMPAAVAEDVGTALRRLEAALAKHCPGALNALEPGLSDDEITRIEREHGLHLTKDLKALYGWRNGTAPGVWVDLIPGRRFVSLQEAASLRDETARELKGQSVSQRIAYAAFAGHRNGWMTVVVDGSGDGYFYDQSRRNSGGSFFYCFAEDGTYRFFPSVTNFLIGAAECYESQIYRCDAAGKPSEDYVRSFALWPRYASSPGG